MTDNSFTNTGSAFAIVSPCSQCKNQLSAMSADGKPYCPRRKWQADQSTYQTTNSKLDPQVTPLTLYGTEGGPNAGDQSFRNPVYSNDNKASLVWIATLRDNSGVRDGNDNVIAPSILDPTFIPDHTDYIHCRSLPYIPATNEASYRQLGALKEGDTVIAIGAQNQQSYSSTSVNGNTSDFYKDVLIEGVVMKVNLVFKTPRVSVDVDHVIQGT